MIFMNDNMDRIWLCWFCSILFNWSKCYSQWLSHFALCTCWISGKLYLYLCLCKLPFFLFCSLVY